MTIVFVFIGLIAFVPNDAPTGVHAILVNAMDPWVASDGQTVPDHQPFIAVNRAVVDSGACPQELSKDYGAWCSILLDYDDVTVEGNLAEAKTAASKGEAPIVEIEQILRSTLAAKGELLDPKPARSLVAGRFTLDAGTLHGVDICGDQVVFETLAGLVIDPPPGKPLPPQPVADLAYAAFTTQDTKITLRIKRFNSMDSGRTLVINAVGSSRTAIVFVGNTAVTSGAHHASAAGFFDRHFERFYDLAAEEPASHRRPVPYEPTLGNPLSLPDWLVSALPSGPGFIPLCIRGLSERTACTMAQY